MKENTSVSRYIIKISVSVCIAAVISVLLLMLFAALSLKAEDPSALVLPLSYVTLGIASLVCGICAVLMNRRSIFPYYMTASLAGAVLVLIMFIVSFIPAQGMYTVSDPVRAAMYGAVVTLSLFGGLLARPRAKKHARARMKRRYR